MNSSSVLESKGLLMFCTVRLAILAAMLAGSAAMAAPVGIVNDQSHAATIWVWSPVANAWTKIKVKSGQESQFTVDESQTAYVVVESEDGELELGWLDFTGLTENNGDLTYHLAYQTVTEEIPRKIKHILSETVTVIVHGREVTRTYRRVVFETMTYQVTKTIPYQAFVDTIDYQVDVPTFDASPPPFPGPLR